MIQTIQQWLRLYRVPLAVVGIAVLIFLLLRTQPSVVTAAELDAQLASGRPTVIEFYSNF